MRPIDADKLQEEYTQLFVDAYGIKSAEMFRGTISQMPTLDVKPTIKGKWSYNRHYKDNYKDVYALCSVCGAERKYDLTDNWHYCPNCGADMRESEGVE